VGYVVNGIERGVEGTRLDAGELRVRLQKKLPEYMIPGRIVVLEKMPRTPQGKIHYRDLPEGEKLGSGAECVPPRDSVELELVKIWQEILKIDSIGIQNNFFACGGHSLLAVRLVSLIEKRMGKKLPVAVLFHNPNIEELATVLRSQGTRFVSNALVPIQSRGSKPPLFLVHGAGGSAFVFNPLAGALGPDQPLFAFQDKGLDQDNAGDDSIECMAQEYVVALRTMQPKGPYQLGGWSAGGLIAFEMARQLTLQGQEVACLVLLDPSPIKRKKHSLDDRVLFAGFLLSLGFSSADVERLNAAGQPLEASLEKLREFIEGTETLPHGFDLAAIRRWFNVYRKHAHAVRRYTPVASNVRIYLWQAGERLAMVSKQQGAPKWIARLREWFRPADPTAGWKDCSSDVRSGAVPGDHYSLLREPHVQALARELLECLGKSSQS
jgi:thioesterase domain-containing protein/acyl carrier protein